MTIAYDEAPTMNGQSPTEPTDRKRGQRRMRDLLEHAELGVQLTDEIRELHIDLLDQESTATGMGKRRIANRAHLVGLLLAALDEFHGIEAG